MAYTSEHLHRVRFRTYHPITDYEDTDVIILPKLIEASQVLKLAVRDRECNNLHILDIVSLGVTLSLEEILTFIRNIKNNHIEIKYEKNAPMYYILGHYLFDTYKFEMTTFTQYLIGRSTPVDETRIEIAPTYTVPNDFKDLLEPELTAEFNTDADAIMYILETIHDDVEIKDEENAPLVVQVCQKFFPWITLRMEDHVYAYVCTNPKVNRDKLGKRDIANFTLRNHMQIYKYLKGLSREELYNTVGELPFGRIFIDKSCDLYEGRTHSQKLAAAHGREFPQWFNAMVDSYGRMLLDVFGTPEKLYPPSITIFRRSLCYLLGAPIIHDSKKWHIECHIPQPVEPDANAETRIVSYPVTATTNETFIVYGAENKPKCLFLLKELAPSALG